MALARGRPLGTGPQSSNGGQHEQPTSTAFSFVSLCITAVSQNGVRNLRALVCAAVSRFISSGPGATGASEAGRCADAGKPTGVGHNPRTSLGGAASSPGVGAA